MTLDLAIVLAILCGAIVLFVLGKPRADAVALIAMILLPLSGAVSYREALEGFSNPNIILIACLFVIGEGLVRTGVAQAVGDWLIRQGGDSEGKLVLLIMGAVALMGSVMSSTAVVAIFIPVVLRIARKSSVASRKILLPMGTAAAISGMMTLVATTPNLILNSALVYAGYEGYGFFDFAPLGVAVLAVGMGYMLLMRRYITAGEPAQPSVQRPSLAGWVDKYALHGRAYRLRITPFSGLVGHSLASCHQELGERACVIAIERSSRFAKAIMQATDDGVLEPGDVLLLDVDADDFSVADFCQTHYLQQLPMAGAYFSDQARDVGMVEVIIPADSRLVGAPTRQSALLQRHGLFVVGIWRHRKALHDVHVARLRAGDTVLVVGPWKGIFALQSVEHDLVSLALPVETDALVPAPDKAPYALLSLAVVVVLMLTDWLPNVMAGLIGCLLIGLFRCINLDTAYRAINWRALILIIGMLPFAIALKRSGGVDLAAQYLLYLSEGWGQAGQVAIVFVVTVCLGIVISGTATAVLMGPVAISLAEASHVAPHAYVMGVAIASSAAFMSPISTPSNALVSVAGGYGFTDYLKLGTPLMVLTLLLSMVLIPWLFPM